MVFNNKSQLQITIKYDFDYITKLVLHFKALIVKIKFMFNITTKSI